MARPLRRARVGLFDADLYGPNVPIMLGIRTEKASFPMSGTDHRGRSHGFIPLGRSDTKPYIRPLKRYGIHIMSVGLWYADRDPIMDDPSLGAHMIRQTLQDTAWDTLDFLILDLPPGTGEPQRTLLRAVGIDGIILVTTPQEMARMDTGRSIGFFRTLRAPLLGVVENMGSAVCPHCGKLISIFSDADHPLLQPRLDSPQALAFFSLAATVRGLFPGTAPVVP